MNIGKIGKKSYLVPILPTLPYLPYLLSSTTKMQANAFKLQNGIVCMCLIDIHIRIHVFVEYERRVRRRAYRRYLTDFLKCF